MKEESGMEEERMAEAVLSIARLETPSSQVVPDVASQAAQAPCVAAKRRRAILGKQPVINTSSCVK